MLNAMQLEEYKKIRASGTDPYNALRHARAFPPRHGYEWDDAGSGRLWRMTVNEPTNEGDCVVHVNIVYDEHPDHSWIGTFHAHEVPGAEDWHLFNNIQGRSRHNIMQWFLPQFTYDELLQDMHGMSRGDAHLKASHSVRQQMEQMREIENGDSLCVGITATAYLDDIELGHDSCWGYVFNPGNADQWSYINDAAREIIGNAVASATENLCPTCHGSGRKAADG
jgi:hypothetical protein